LFTFDSNIIANGGSFNDGLNTWQLVYAAATGGSNFSGEYVAGSFVNITSVPEPTAGVLFAVSGLAALALRRRPNR